MPNFSDRMRDANQNRHQEKLSKYPQLKKYFGKSTILILVEGPTDCMLLNKVVYAVIKSPADPLFSYPDNSQGQSGVKRILEEEGPKLTELIQTLPEDARSAYAIFAILDKDNEKHVPSEHGEFKLFYYDQYDLENFVFTKHTYRNYRVSQATCHVEDWNIEKQREKLVTDCELLTGFRQALKGDKNKDIQKIILDHIQTKTEIRDLIKKRLKSSSARNRMNWNNKYTRGKELIWLVMASVKNTDFKNNFNTVLLELINTFIKSEFHESRLYSDLKKFQQDTCSSLQFKVYQ